MIKFLDLQKVTSNFEPELSQEVQKVIQKGWFLQGEEVSSFETEYSEYIGSKHCVGVGNGLDALRLILKAYIEMGVMHEGDEVIVPANTYIATILAISDNRLKPVLVEPDINTLNINLTLIEDYITSRTRAIMIVHLYGRTCWSENLEALAKRYKLKIIEDNAQAAGARVLASISRNGESTSKRTGSLGDAAGHSFYPGKNLGAIGDAGAVTTDDDELATIIRSLGNYGSSKKYINEYQGINSRLDEIQAAVLRVKLKTLDIDNQKRCEIAEIYGRHINNPLIILPNLNIPDSFSKELSHVWHIFALRLKNRDKFQEFLLQNGIQTMVHYPIPPHKQQAYKSMNDTTYPITEKIHEEVISLPLNQNLENYEVEQIIKSVNGFK